MPAHTNLGYSNDEGYIHTSRSFERDSFPDLTDGRPSNEPQTVKGPPRAKNRYITVGILCLINLINYMDRFTIAGKLFIYHSILSAYAFVSCVYVLRMSEYSYSIYNGYKY